MQPTRLKLHDFHWSQLATHMRVTTHPAQFIFTWKITIGTTLGCVAYPQSVADRDIRGALSGLVPAPGFRLTA
jgi:hypothetical protein